MIAITEEFKEALVEEINTDAEFGFELFQAILESAGERIPSVTYLDKALARQAVEFKKALCGMKNELDEKFDAQAQHFDQKLDDQAQHFDEKLDQRIGKLERFIDAKLGYIGSRWGEDVEATFLTFAQEMIAQGGDRSEMEEENPAH